MSSLNVLALPKYGDEAASMRQRLQQFIPALEKEGMAIEVDSLLGNEHIRRISEGLGISFLQVFIAYMKRSSLLIFARKYDVVWLHCESFPYLPSLFERLAFFSGRPVVLDFDDAIFHQYDSHRSSLVRRWLGKKLQALMGGARICAVGNTYLATYAERFCADVRVLPTVVDTSIYKPVPDRAAGKQTTIGWIGTPTTWNFVKPLVPMLQKLAERPGVAVKIIGAGRMDEPPAGLQFVDWCEDREVVDIQSMDIGIMPLPDEPWARGKCGYKLIQYMACGLPVVASPVGVNRSIVEDGRNGYLAGSPEEFLTCIERLIVDPASRSHMGAVGRSLVESDYSLAAHAPRFVQIINDAAAR